MSSRPEGTALVSGYWKIKDNKKSTGLALQINGDQSIRLPGLMTVVVVPVVEGEIEKMVETYIATQTKQFDNGV